MKKPAQADIQQWSDEVARDPRSLAFLPLARAYRRQGLRDAALQLCLRGLEAYPEHVEAHSVLAALYLDSGDLQKAADEWSIVLRFDPDNFEALRGMGFWCFERDQLSRARQLLERAARQRPDDAAVRGALLELGTRQELLQPSTRAAAPASPPRADGTAPAAAPSPTDTFVSADAPFDAGAHAPASPGRPFELVATRTAHEPSRLFEELLSTGPLLGALLVDTQGLVLGGRLTAAAAADATTLGAVLGDALTEAARTAAHLGLGNWRGVLVEAEHALLHIRPVDGSNALVIAAQRDTPTGWLLRTSAQAAAQATRYVREYA